MSTLHVIEQVKCICLDLYIYNILRNTEETSSKHGTISTYVEPPREEKTRPKNTWQRNTEKERKMGYTGRESEKMATNRQEWRTMVDYPCSKRANRTKFIEILNTKQVQGYVKGFGYRVVQLGSLT